MTFRLALAALLAASVLAPAANAAALDDGLRALRAHDIDAAIHHLKPLADLGDPDAAWMLGTIRDDDTDRRHRDDTQAYTLLARAARAGNPMAAAELLRMRTRGKISFLFEAYGLSQAQIDALAPLRRAAESGQPDAISPEDLTRLAVATCESMGRRTDKGVVDTAADNQPALAWLQRAAEAGQPQAEFLTGLAYLGRQPCYVAHQPEPDVATAHKWLRKAAADGVVRSQVLVAQLDMAPPAGVTPDLAASLAGLRSAAARDDAAALATLADYTERGLGLPADAAEARRLRERSASLGDPEAMWALVAPALKDKDPSPDQQRQTFDAVRRCAEATLTRCEYELAMLHIQGRGTPQDDDAFIKWLKLASRHDDANAAAHLGQYLLLTPGPHQDPKAGIDYLRMAVSRGQAVAMYRLADEYRSGEHLPKDLSKAWALYKLAARGGVRAAQATADRIRLELKGDVIDRGDELAAAWRPDRRPPGSWDWRTLATRPPDGF